MTFLKIMGLPCQSPTPPPAKMHQIFLSYCIKRNYQSAGVVKYTDCRKVGPPPPPLNMTLNSIWRWGSSPVALRNIEYLIFAITPRSTLTRSSCTCQGFNFGLSVKLVRVLDMKLNCMQWCGSIPGALGNVVYSFIDITPRSNLTRSSGTC